MTNLFKARTAAATIAEHLSTLFLMRPVMKGARAKHLDIACQHSEALTKLLGDLDTKPPPRPKPDPPTAPDPLRESPDQALRFVIAIITYIVPAYVLNKCLLTIVKGNFTQRERDALLEAVVAKMEPNPEKES